MDGNYNKNSKKMLMLESVLAFVVLAVGVVFFGCADIKQPAEKAKPFFAVSQPPIPVKPVKPVKPAAAKPVPVFSDKAESAPISSSEPVFEQAPAAETAKKEYVKREAVYVGVEHVLNGSALNMAKNSDVGAIMVNMKHDSGNLNWYSEQEIAQKLGLGSKHDNINEKLREFLADDEFYMIARISAFKDRLVGAEMEYAVVNNKGNYWTDEKGVFWTSVGNADIRDYVVGCAIELAELGFDEIMIENAASPDSGYLEPLPETERFDTASEELFLNELRSAIADTGVYLSIKPNQAALTAEEPVNSLTIDMVKNNFDHCWESVEGVVGLLESKTCDELLK